MTILKRDEELRVVPEGRDSQKASRAIEKIREARRSIHGRRSEFNLPALELPLKVVDALEAILEELSEGHSVVLSTSERRDPELTTTEAAELLGMSRPTLINLLEAREIPYRMVGTHRRIRRSHVRAYLKQTERSAESDRRRRRLEALRDMADITHEAGEGY